MLCSKKTEEILKSFAKKFNKDVAFLDLETTSENAQEARICSLSVYKIKENENVVQTTLVEPGVEIPEEASSIHGLTNKKLKNCPKFKNTNIVSLLKNSIVIGYNLSTYDLPVLKNELLRNSMVWSDENQIYIDAMMIWWKKENLCSGRLDQCLKFYTNLTHPNHHDPEADVNALKEIFAKQIEKYKLLDLELVDIARIRPWFTGNTYIDGLSPFYSMDNNNVFITFGIHKGKNLNDVMTNLDVAEHQIWSVTCSEKFNDEIRKFLHEKLNEMLNSCSVEYLTNLSKLLLPDDSSKRSKENEKKKCAWFAQFILNNNLEENFMDFLSQVDLIIN